MCIGVLRRKWDHILEQQSPAHSDDQLDGIRTGRVDEIRGKSKNFFTHLLLIVKYIQVERDSFCIEWQIDNFDKILRRPALEKVKSDIFYAIGGRLALRFSAQPAEKDDSSLPTTIRMEIVNPTPHNSNWSFTVQMRQKNDDNEWTPWTISQFAIFFEIILFIL